MALVTNTDRLPERARLKWRHLVDQEREAKVLVNDTVARITNLRLSLTLTPHGTDAPALQDEIARLQDTLADKQQRHSERARLLAEVRQWLDTMPRHATYEDVRPGNHVRIDGESYRGAVSRLRVQLMDLNRERLKVQRAGMPLADRKAAIHDHVAKLSKGVRPYMSFTAGAVHFGFGEGGQSQLRPEVFLAWLDPNALMARLDSELESAPSAAFELSAADKLARLQKLAAEIALVEEDEERALMSAERQGDYIARRSNASPIAVLGVRIKIGHLVKKSA